MNRIDSKFKELKKKKKKAFIGFITAGYPNISLTKSLLYELSGQGVDIIELGVPFSDPLADGLTIQESSQAALEKGISLAKIISMVKDARKKIQTPILLMSYYNPLYAYGLKKLARDAHNAGIDGFIIPDLPPEEAEEIYSNLKKYNIHLVFLAAPTNTKKRLEFITKSTNGFVYYVSLTGVTGQRSKLPRDLVKKIKLCKSLTSKPVCVGFGVSNPEQVKSLIKHADGVIVGSAIVKTIQKYMHDIHMVGKVGNAVKKLVSAANDK